MAVTIVTTGSDAERLSLHVSPLAELASLLHLLADPAHHLPFGALAQQMEGRLDASEQAELRSLSPLWTGYRARFLYPIRPEGPADIATEIDSLLQLDELVFVEMSAWAVRGGNTGAPDRAQLTTGPGRRSVLERARSRSDSAHALARRLFDDPTAFRERVVQGLDLAAAAFASELRTVEAALQVEAQRRRDLAARHGITAALSGITTAARVMSAPQRVVFDKLHRATIDLRRIPLLALPSVYAWPHLLVKHELGWPPIVQYPLGAPGVRSDTPSLDTVRRRLSALIDPSRIRLCRLIAREALSTTELAERTGLAVPQVSRLLRPLREQGLVSSSRRGHFVLYRLDLDVMSRLGPDLLNALLR